VLQHAQLNQICIQMTTAACTPPTQNSIEMCSTDVKKEHTNRQTGICFCRYCIPLWTPWRRLQKKKRRIHLPFEGWT